ncbi:Dymeclin [Varanus komodoensis]|nr:Dymeclin [Varanus komodoensis]
MDLCSGSVYVSIFLCEVADVLILKKMPAISHAQTHQGLVYLSPKKDFMPPSMARCDDFAKHFKEKIAQIRHELDSTSDSEPSGELLKKAKDGIGTWILEVVNASLRDSRVPAPLKEAVVQPVLKKASLDPEVVANYRPVANIPFLGKVLERVVAGQLQALSDENDYLDPFQSSFRPGYGTESALVTLYDDLCRERDRGSASLLVLLHLSVAFDTIDHGILLDRLAGLGVGGTALQWFRSYLNGRFQKVVLGDYGSAPWQLCHGVPQGSILSPLLFNIYMKPLGEVIRRCGLRNHQYTDDTQLYLLFSSKPGEAVAVLNRCLAEVMGWMRANKLKLNPDKTKVLDRVRSLGVLLDPELSLEAQVTVVARSAFLHLQLIHQLRPYLENDCLATVTHALVRKVRGVGGGHKNTENSGVLEKSGRTQSKGAIVESSRKVVPDHHDPMDNIPPGSPVLHHPLESTQPHTHCPTGLWTVFTLGGVGSKRAPQQEESSPLANQSLLLLLVLANLTDAPDTPNPYRQAIMSFKNTQDSTALPSPNPHTFQINFNSLYTTLCEQQNSDQATLLLYTLLHQNSNVRTYMLARTDMENLVLPILEILYHVEERNSHHVYMALIILLILTEDDGFNRSIHEVDALTLVRFFVVASVHHTYGLLRLRSA